MAKVGKLNSASVIARKYIQENIDKKDVKEIINYSTPVRPASGR